MDETKLMGDGITDDTAAMQEIIDAGKVITLPDPLSELTAQLQQGRAQFGALFGVAAALHDALQSADEWVYFGNRDTRRCFWCKAWLKLKQGHKPNCKRDRALKLWNDFINYSNSGEEP